MSSGHLEFTETIDFPTGDFRQYQITRSALNDIELFDLSKVYAFPRTLYLACITAMIAMIASSIFSFEIKLAVP